MERLGAVIMTIVPVFLRELEREFDVVGASQLVLAAALIGFMIFRRQGLLGSRELRVPVRFGRPTADVPPSTPKRTTSSTSSYPHNPTGRKTNGES